MKQTTLFRCCQNGYCTRSTCRAQIRSFKRIDGNVYSREPFSSTERFTNPLTDEKHGSFVTFSLTYDNLAVNGHVVKTRSHCFNCNVVGMVAVALTHCPCTRNGRLLHHIKERMRDLRATKFGQSFTASRYAGNLHLVGLSDRYPST
jgi:hypothetical protein